MTERPLLRGGSLVFLACLALAIAGCGGGGERKQPDGGDEDDSSASSCVLSEIPSPVFGTVQVGYELFDRPASFADLTVEYSLDGGTSFLPATEGRGGDGTVRLASSPAGEFHLFAWDLVTDLPEAARQNVEDVLLRITPVERSASGPDVQGESCVSEPFTVRGDFHRLRIANLATGLAQQELELPVSIQTGASAGGPLRNIVLDLQFDPTLLGLIDARPGGDAGAASAMFELVASGSARISLLGLPEPFAGGEILILIAETPCAAPIALPAVTEIACAQVMGEDAPGNPVAIECEAPARLSLIDNSIEVGVTDSVLASGATGARVPVTLSMVQPLVIASSLELFVAWDPAALDVNGVVGGVALPPGSTAVLGGGGGLGLLVITSPPGTAFTSGVIAELLVDVFLPAPASTTISPSGLVLSSSDGCVVAPGRLAPPALIRIGGQRMLVDLRCTSSLGARGGPALVPGSQAPRSPRGNWFPLNSGEFQEEIRLPFGGNPVIFTSVVDAPIQIVLEAGWSDAPAATDVAAATSADGAVVYTPIRGAGNVAISDSGRLTPVVGNACTTYQADFTPNQASAFGAPRSVIFSACVDLGGIDNASRASGLLPAGGLDADIPGLPLGEPIPGVGGTFDTTVVMNTGGLAIREYEVRTTWDAARLELDTSVGLFGYLSPSDVTLGGPVAVDAATPGEGIASNVVAAPAYGGIFDIWDLRLRLLTSGVSDVQHQVIRMKSTDVPPVDIGAPGPRVAPLASASIVFP